MGLYFKHEKKLTQKSLDDFWVLLQEQRATNHSARGMTLSHLIQKCEETKTPYRLTAHPGKGYFLELIEDFS